MMKGITYTYDINDAINADYSIHLTNNLWDELGNLLPPELSSHRSLLVMTPSTDRLYRLKVSDLLKNNGIEVEYLVIPCCEQSKTMNLVNEVCKKSIQMGIGRNGYLISLGGGVCSDAVAFAAGVIRRGISHIKIPTTLIGQIDAGIGVKCGVNFENKKNYMGSFNPPKKVYVDPVFLKTLDVSHLRNGISEIIKMGIIRDEALYEQIEKLLDVLLSSHFQRPHQNVMDILSRSIDGMIAELRVNLYENKSYERKVDFGHTFSPLLEEASGFKLSHGEAVAVDMAVSSSIAVELGLLDKEIFERIVHLIDRIGLPFRHPLLNTELCQKALLSAELHRGGAVNLVVPRKIGEVDFIKTRSILPESLLEAAICSLNCFCSSKQL